MRRTNGLIAKAYCKQQLQIFELEGRTCEFTRGTNILSHPHDGRMHHCSYFNFGDFLTVPLQWGWACLCSGSHSLQPSGSSVWWGDPLVLNLFSTSAWVTALDLCSLPEVWGWCKKCSLYMHKGALFFTTTILLKGYMHTSVFKHCQLQHSPGSNP